MRLLFVVQRYGREVAGGAELLCREFATRLAVRGHDVEVLTSRALSYVDWADEYPAGTATLDGVTVHRLSVTAPRHDRSFNLLNSRTLWGSGPVPLHLQEHWIRSAGPRLAGLDLLARPAGRHLRCRRLLLLPLLPDLGGTAGGVEADGHGAPSDGP